jgi:hypothetical protein
MSNRMPAELRTTRAKNDEEEQLQRSLISRLRLLADPQVIYFHVPNGGARSKSEGANFKAMGVLAGVADLIFFLPDGGVLCMELKRRGGPSSAGQDEFGRRCEAIGITYVVCYDIDNAVAILTAHGVLPA